MKFNPNFREILQSELSKDVNHKFDYIIIDEAQDVADMGIDILLNEMLNLTHNGLSNGRFIVLYDIEQGYNNTVRGLEEVISSISNYAAHYILDENKRVPTNKLIVEYANKILNLDHQQDNYEK